MEFEHHFFCKRIEIYNDIWRKISEIWDWDELLVFDFKQFWAFSIS